MDYIEYYNDYRDKIYSYLYYNLQQDSQLAEDLTSDTFLKGFDKFDTYNSEFSFSTWIFTISRNVLIDYKRKQKGFNISLDDDDNEGKFDDYIKYEEDFGKIIDIDSGMEEVYNALSKIPENQGECITLKYLNDYSTKEISHITGNSEVNIRKLLSRGLKKLTEILSINKQYYE